MKKETNVNKQSDIIGNSQVMIPLLIGLSVPGIWFVIASVMLLEGAPVYFFACMLSAVLGGILSGLLALQSSTQTRKSAFAGVARALCAVVIPFFALVFGLLSITFSSQLPASSGGTPQGEEIEEVVWDPSSLHATYYTRGAQEHGWELLSLSTEVEYDLTRSCDGPVVYGKTNYAKLLQPVRIHCPNICAQQKIKVKFSEHGEKWWLLCGVDDSLRLEKEAGALFVKGTTSKQQVRPFKLYFTVESPEPTRKNGLRIATTQTVKADGEFVHWGSLPHPEQWELYVRFSTRDGGIIGDKRIGECPATIMLGTDSITHGFTVYETASYGREQQIKLSIRPPQIDEFVRMTVILLIRPSNTTQ